MPSKVFEKNLEILDSRFPSLSEKIKSVDISRIGIANAADGGICYAVMNEHNEWLPISNYENPINATQTALDKMQHRLAGGLCPAVIVGLYPGYILESVFKYFQGRLSLNEPFRHIYIVIDSIHCLAAWLKASDRTDILKQEEISFHWHEDVREIVRLCETDLQRSHLFIPLSILPENELNRIIMPLAELYLHRKKEEQLWFKENDEYYNNLTDEELAGVISGRADRKPRLLMPTHMSSTVVQYSTRDTCKAFENMGWETMILKMERDLSPWLMIKTIREFKPDVMIFINHLRNEHEDVSMYPENMMFITWIQDYVPAINRKETAEKWNKIVAGKISETGATRKRDLLTGYVEQLKKFGYSNERLKPLNMIVNTEIFKPRELTDSDIEKYSCDICFASNRGKTTVRIVEDELYPLLAPCGFSKDILMKIHDHLWLEYRNGKTFISYLELLHELRNVDGFNGFYDGLTEDHKSSSIQRIFWILNDTIYRHVVLEWCIESGVKLNLYGKGWSENPYFARYAKGEITHGEELSTAYQCAKYCLHLNSMEGRHQRLAEIILSGANALTRSSRDVMVDRDLLRGVLKIIRLLYSEERAEIQLSQREYNSVMDAFICELTTIEELNQMEDNEKTRKKLLSCFIDFCSNLLDGNTMTFVNKDDLQSRILNLEEKTSYRSDDSTDLIMAHRMIFYEKMRDGIFSLVFRGEYINSNLLGKFEKSLDVKIDQLPDYVFLTKSAQKKNNSDFDKIIRKMEDTPFTSEKISKWSTHYINNGKLALFESYMAECNYKKAKETFALLPPNGYDEDFKRFFFYNYSGIYIQGKTNISDFKPYYKVDFIKTFQMEFIQLFSAWDIENAISLCIDTGRSREGGIITKYIVLGLLKVGRVKEAYEICGSRWSEDLEPDRLLFMSMILRSQGKYDEAVSSARESFSMESAVYWNYSFSYALLLFFMGQVEEALEINKHGIKCQSLDNPSFAFELYCRKEFHEPVDDALINKIKNTYFNLKIYSLAPYYSYPMIIMIMLLDLYGVHEAALQCMEDLVNNDILICPAGRAKLKKTFYKNKEWNNNEFWSVLTESLFPYYPENSFDRLMIGKLALWTAKDQQK